MLRLLSLGLLTFSLFVGVSSRALFVSAHSTSRILALPPTHASSFGARLQPQSTVFRSSTQASPSSSPGTPTFGSSFSGSVAHDRLVHLLPIVQDVPEPSQSPNPTLWCRSGHHSLTRVRDRSTVVATEWHQSVLVHDSQSLPDFPARASTLDSLFNSLTHLLFDSASLRSRRRPTVSRPRTREPLWWNCECYHALVARWRDLHRSGSHEDQARFRRLRQQFIAQFVHPLLERVAWFCDVPLPPCLRALSPTAPSGTLLSLLTFAICSGMAPPALQSLLMRRVPIGAPFFPPQLRTLCFLTTSSTHSLSPLRVSHVLTRVRQIWCSLLVQRTRCCAVQVPRVCAGCGLPPVLFKVFFPRWRHLLLFLQPRLAFRCCSVCLEIQPGSGHQARW